MRTGFERVYSDEQREAMSVAKVDGGMTPKEVVAAASAGLLRLNGMKLDPFTINSPDTVKYYARRLRNRRMGNVQTQLPEAGKDALAVLKRRWIIRADTELAAMERQPAGKLDWERMRLAARAMREAAAIPDPADRAVPAPGQRDTANGGRKNAGAAKHGALLEAMKSGTQPIHRASEQVPPVAA